MSVSVDIEKTAGAFSLKVQFEAGNETLALLGASGCGKSMTLKCIAGIETPDRGRITVDGVTLFDSEKKIDLPPQERRVGLMFQNYALFPNMTVLQNIRAGGEQNVIRFQVVEEIENPFSVTVMLRPVGAEDAVPVGWETDKETWTRLRADELDICLPVESLLLLEDDAYAERSQL